MRPLIFDTFLYNGDEILTFRLDHLYDYVDYFIIIEALETFSGIKKSEYFIDRVLPQLYKYTDKIIVVRVAETPPRDVMFTFSSNGNPDDWWRERMQREACKPIIAEIGKGRPFIALVGDVDEFPSHQIFVDLDFLYQATRTPMWLYMDLFYYNFCWKKRYKWDQYFILNDNGFFLDHLSQHKIFGDRRNFRVDGWHFSYFMSKENIAKKIENVAHVEFNKPEFKDEVYLRKVFETGIDLYGRGTAHNCTLNTDFTNLPKGWEKFQLMLGRIQ